jgi:signal transduction histidine kinase
MQLRTRLLRTSTFRLAFAYTLVFAASGFCILACIYWATTSLMDRGIVEAINAETEELARQYRLGGLPVLVAEVDRRGASYRGRSQLYLITDPRLVGLAGNVSGWPSEEPNARGWVDFPIHEPGVGADGEHSARARLIRLEGGYHLLVGHDMTERDRFGRIMTGAMAVALLITVLVGLLGGLLMGRRVLGRLEAVNRTSREILGGALDRRIPLTGHGDEFDQLADNLNAMLERLEKLMNGMRQMTDNVAHDLRSPLSRLRSRLEVTLLSQPDAAAYREALVDTVTEVDGVLATFNALLGIARIEAGTMRVDTAPVDLATLAEDAAELYQPLAEERGLELETELTPGLTIRADRHLLSQAIANLLDNAIKYAPEGGKVGLATLLRNGRPAVTVTDTGPGIPADKRVAVLGRFVRLEESRNAPGSGLGLSLVAAVAEHHGAALRLEDNQPGLRVTIDFPETG